MMLIIDTKFGLRDKVYVKSCDSSVFKGQIRSVNIEHYCHKENNMTTINYTVQNVKTGKECSYYEHDLFNTLEEAFT